MQALPASALRIHYSLTPRALPLLASATGNDEMHLVAFTQGQGSCRYCGFKRRFFAHVLIVASLVRVANRGALQMVPKLAARPWAAHRRPGG
jgi:hypothetical protein